MLYRYLFRGLGLVLVIGMLTILFLALRSQNEPAETLHPAAHSAERR